MIFIVPIMQMLILVFAATYDIKRIDMVVVDKDMSTASRELIAKFDGIPFFNVVKQEQSEKIAEKMQSDISELAGGIDLSALGINLPGMG